MLTPLEKREQFSVSLRKLKKEEILRSKRKKLSVIGVVSDLNNLTHQSMITDKEHPGTLNFDSILDNTKHLV